ncbi:MAG: sensor domain-containing diguanylate cyclase [Rhodocyclaceae bacterium]|nr:MAG: sensor domain-containing diguanylate cyclase [Rhodocyclaceae bacterium]
MDTNHQDRLLHSIDLLLDAVFLVEASGRIAYVNAACERIFQYTADELIGRPMIDFVAPEDRDCTLQEAVRIMAGHPRVGFENRYVRKDGSRVHIMWSACWSDADNMRIGVARDVTEQKRAEAFQAATYAIADAALKADDLDSLFPQIHRIIAERIPLTGVAVATSDRQSTLLSFPYQQDQFGSAPLLDEPVAHRYCSEVIGSGHPLLISDLNLLPPGTASTASTTWLFLPLVTRRDAIGALILRADAGTFDSQKDRELLNFVATQVAIAVERGQLRAELVHAAQYDELTGLPNRRLFHERLDRALGRSQRRQGHMALLYVDIDDFKKVNDTLGHAAGDLLLQEIARRLGGCVRHVDTVARLGGDEFVVIIEDIHGPADAAQVADKIRRSLLQEFVIGGVPLHTRASIGVAIHPDDGRDADALLKHADSAMYQGKALGRSR